MNNNQYSDMQRKVYNNEGENWSLENRWRVVGPFDTHNSWPDNEYLFKDIPDKQNKDCLEFGCGPGRNLVNYHSLFKSLDGVDISHVILDKAKVWLEHNNIKTPNLHNNSGYDLKCIADNSYDIIFSTICFQHICVYDIRFSLLEEFYRVLRPGGYLSIQMGYGWPSEKSVQYHVNNWQATETNRACDTAVENVNFILDDITKVGFINFTYYIRPVGPGDFHPNWIYWNTQKPN